MVRTQIKIAVRAAHAVAKSGKEHLSYKHMETVNLKAMNYIAWVYVFHVFINTP